MAKTPLPPLDQIDPTQAWRPWKPSRKEPFDLKWAGHLYRRATFGAHLTDLRKAVETGLDSTLQSLLQGAPNDDERQRFLITTGERIAAQNNPYQLRGWWLYSMVHTTHPLREKMTLFWHNHFATSIGKVMRATLMLEQNRLLRQHALGKFEPFLQAMSKDPAMLIWLDSNSNVKGKPNENYAREVMELFSLGVGNYTEKDIQEAARAFTGWHTDGESKFDFVERLHDEAEKTVLGRTGNWNGDDVVRICLEQKACPYFIVRKLYRFFISENAVPPDRLLEPLAEQYRKSGFDTGALVRTILGSRHFFSPHAYRQRIKSPVEFVLGAVHDIGQKLVEPRSLVGQVDNLGQTLFAPPNVKGWEGGQAWLNTATVLARYNFAQSLTTGSGRVNLGENPVEMPAVGVAIDPAALVRREKLTEPEAILNFLAELLLQGDLREAARAKLLGFLKEGNPGDAALSQRVRETFHAIMTLPEYQLA